jgi:ABC-2 type transport system permease protein
MKLEPVEIWCVATNEFGSAIRAKAFLISLLFLPVIMGVSIAFQLFLAKRADTKTRTVAVVDPGGDLFAAIENAAEAYNRQAVDPTGKAIRPKIVVTNVEPASADNDRQIPDLSERVRRGELDAFVVIPAATIHPPPEPAQPPALAYHSDNPNDDVVRKWLDTAVNTEVRARRFRAAGIDPATALRVNRPVAIDNLGLEAEKVDPIRTAAVPAVLMFIMFFVTMTSAPQLLNSVLEEKMSKISEVLLGSITPFELLLGKLAGNTGIALFLATLYIGGGYIVASYYGYGDVVPIWLLAALGFFLVMAIMLYGSLYMAVGSACSELKDAQSLMMPIMLLSMFPVFVWTAVLQNPSSALSVGMSLFPPASPFLMLMRLALHPTPPLWQVLLAVILTTGNALLCVWAGAKIFRTGLLMQGKAPSFRELARWVMAR